MSQPRIARVAGRNYWHIVWTENGKTRRRTTKTEDRIEAEAALEDFVSEQPGYGRPIQIVATQIVDAYIDARAEVIVAPEALRYRAKPLKKFFGRRLPQHIKREKCRAYVSRRRTQGCSDATIRSELGLLSSAMRYAFEEGWIDRRPKIELPPPPPPKERWLERHEAKKLIDACNAYHLKLFVLIALNTGARSGAILQLEWDRVDLDQGRIDFNPLGRVQTKKRRPTVPVNAALRQVLSEALERATSDYVIEWGGKPVKKINRAFRRAAERAKLKGVTPHTLRHTCATWMAQGKVGMWQIAGMLGHADSRTTDRIYAKHHPDYLKDASAVLGECVGGFSPNPIHRADEPHNPE